MTPQRRGELQDALDLLLQLDPQGMREALMAVLEECGVWPEQIATVVKSVEEVCITEGVVSPGASICFLGVHSPSVQMPPAIEVDCNRNTLHKSSQIVWEFFPNVWVGEWECHVWLGVVEMSRPLPALESASSNSWLYAGVCN